MMNEQLYQEIGEELSSSPDVTMSKMFGAPCLKTGSKAFAVFSKGIMAFKLGWHEVNLMKQKYPGAENWDPSGKNKPMKDWLHVPAEFNKHWQELAIKALEYVNSIN